MDFSPQYEEVITLRQTQIAREWDEIEQTLRKDSFWYFISDDTVKYSSRIEFILDMIALKPLKDAEDHFTFHNYNARFANERSDDLWQEVKDVFMRFNEWYNDRDLYHLIGFLTLSGHPIDTILNDSKTSNKNEFKAKLRDSIKGKVDCDLKTLKYQNPIVRNVLLLFNIETILSSGNPAMRFPFDIYVNENWDIEHIRAVKSQKPTIRHKQITWLKSVLEYFTGSDILDTQISEIFNLEAAVQLLATKAIELVKAKKWDDTLFDDVYYCILKHFGEDDEKDVNNSISNLTLLDSTTNRSYKNAVYPVKRKRILRNDNDGLYVPVCTKNVFLKSYSSNISDMMHWYEYDQNDYLNQLGNTLSQYLTSN